MSSKTRIGFVGVGSMGQMAHLQNYVTLDDCEVVAIAEVREKTAELVAQRYGVPKVYKDHREMLRNEKLDGIVASQQFQHHAILFPELYKNVKFLLSEKPLAVSPQAGDSLAAGASQSGCTHMLGYHKRSDPATVYAKRIIDEWKSSGVMGKMRYVRISMPAGDWIASGFTGMLDGGDARPSLVEEPSMPDLDKKTTDAYVWFVNYYIHQVNLMRHLLGEDYGVAYAEKSGTVFATESVSGIAGVVETTPYYTTLEWEESALVAFQKGYVLLRLPAPLAVNRCGTVEIYEDPGNGKTPMRSMPTMPWMHAMRQQAINFVKVCKGEMKPPCDAAEAALDLHVAREYIRLRFGK